MKKNLLKTVYLCITALIISMSCFCLPASSLPSVRGVWVGSVANLDFPSKQGLTSSQLKAELDSIVSNCKENGINTVFFQVRPNADALYNSSVFPWSRVLTGTQGTAPDSNFDPLAYMVQACHNNGIELHAWINPYRICKADELDTLCATSPAVLHPEYTVTCSDGGVYFNPALTEVQELIVSGVTEIVQTYDVDGIHFDDYFYPYNVTDYPDAEDYKKYGNDFDSVGDFRRNNVNTLVKKVYNAVHSQNKNVLFGISPFGIWDNKRDNPDGSDTTGMSSYREIYADSRAWVQNGWVDYICPQIYWSFENTDAPFETLVRWWSSLCKPTDVDLYIGHALYKLGGGENGFDSADEIQRQLELCDTVGGVDGSVLFRYGTLRDNVLGCADILKTDKKTEYSVPETPAVTSTDITVTSPDSGYTTTADSCSIIGYTDPSLPLTANKKTVTLTENGYFCVYTPLSAGKNTITFSNGVQTKTVTVVRNEPEPVLLPEAKFYEGSAYPSGKCTFSPASTVTLSVDAVPEIEVYASVGGNDIRLLENNVSDTKSTYTADITVPNTAFSDLNYGSVTFYALVDGQKVTCSQTADITVSAAAKTLYVTEECYAYDSVFGGSMMDNYQLPKGSVVTATAFSNDSYRLLCGKWVSKEHLSEKKIRASTDIDTDNYKKITLSADTVFEAYGSVNEKGVLVIDLYGIAEPRLETPDGVAYRIVDKGNCAALIIKSVNGFSLVRRSDTVLDIYVYDKRPSVAGKTIVIDAGHGGDDCGALGPVGDDGATEAALNLSLSQLVAQKLADSGAKVVLTRKDDSTLLLDARAALIRESTPDLSISIHHNSADISTDYNNASGVLVLYSRETSLALANKISRSLTRGLSLKNEGVRAQSLNVCREYRFPSVLIECGYVCNPSEYELLLTDTVKERLSDNIVSAICDYFGENG